MSAIAVVLDLRGDRLDPGAFREVLGATQDRGPDGHAEWVEGPIGLGHQSLALTREEVGERQPVKVGDLVGVFDGRLDNRAELIANLFSASIARATVTDSELAVRAFARWGTDVGDHLLGDFGIAVWNVRAQELYCLRDHLGVRPLYYSCNGRTLVVATDVRGVIGHRDVSRDPNERSVADVLQWTASDSTSTLYAEVQRLAPGHELRANVADAGRSASVETRRYWDVDLTREIRCRDEREYVELLSALFTDAIRDRLRSRDSPTVALSGGLDSTLVAAFASELAADCPSTFRQPTATSLVYPGMDCDETTFIDGVASNIGLSTRKIRWRPLAWEEVVAAASRTGYLPPYPNATFDTFVSNGIDREVVLTGVGGDQWMNGFDVHFADLITDFRFRELGTHVVHGGARVFARVVASAIRARTVDRVARPPIVETPAWLGPALQLSALESAKDVTPTIPRIGTRAQRKRYQQLHDPWEPHVFELADQSGGRGLSARHPFYDRRIVEFLFAVGDSQRWHGSDQRWLERRVLQDRVPDWAAMRRSKAEFTSVFARQVKALGLDNVLGHSQVVGLGWITNDTLDRIRQEAAALGDPNHGVIQAWCIAAVEAWLRGQGSLS